MLEKIKNNLVRDLEDLVAGGQIKEPSDMSRYFTFSEIALIFNEAVRVLKEKT